jgi:hypothetical protein
MITRTVTPSVITTVAVLILFATGGQMPAVAADMTVYKDAQCGCCTKWVEHLRANGFNVTTHNEMWMDRIKSTHGVPAQLASCHTAIVDGYVVEGHVPADVIKRLLRERPAVKGIAVPGMPAGSPGMEGPRAQRYDILSFDAQGKTKVYDSR